MSIAMESYRSSFRPDLHFRLNVAPIHVPPLRKRREDILPLVNCFLNRFNREFDKDVRFTSEALVQAEKRRLPGNVRELENSIERMVVLASGSLVRKKDIAEHIREEAACKKHRSTRKIARTLEISRSAVVRRMNLYNNRRTS